jgi:uncharacterized repeat protein (TIGR01451 family)
MAAPPSDAEPRTAAAEDVPDASGTRRGLSLLAAFIITVSSVVFVGSEPVSAAPNAVSGTVFEDLVGDALADGTVGDGNNPGAVGVSVSIYPELLTTSISTVTAANDIGKGTAIAVGSDGDPVVAYYDATARDLWLARCDDPACTTVTPTLVDGALSDVGQYPDIAIGSDGFPIISYWSQSLNALMVADCTDLTCSAPNIRTVDNTSNAGKYTSIVVPADGRPYISYWNESSKDLRVARCDDPTCATSTLTTVDAYNNSGAGTSIAIGSDGFPVISYYEDSGKDLRFAHCGDAACTPGLVTTRSIQTADNVGLYSSIGVGGDGYPVIAYYDDSNKDLRVAHCNDLTCSAPTLTTTVSTNNVGEYLSLDIGGDGFPVIAYHDDSIKALAAVDCGDALCSAASARVTTLHDPGNTVGQYAAMVLSDVDSPLVSYYDSNARNLLIYGSATTYPVPAAAVQSTVTGADGTYSFSGLGDGLYWVVADSKTVPSMLDPAATATDIWAEQTYGPRGGQCVTAGNPGLSAAGTCFGGRRVDPNGANPASDDLTSWSSGAEHLALVDTRAGSNVSNLDFGFSFNVVTTTRGGDATDDDGATNRTVQGSLRQYVQNANAIQANGGTGFDGANAMYFVPAEAANASGGGHSWWRLDVTSALPAVTDDKSTIDGTVHDAAAPGTVLDTNTATIGAAATVGRLALPADTTPVLDPELEIRGDNVVTIGLDLQASDTTVRDLSIWRFGVDGASADLRVGSVPLSGFTGTLIERNVIGQPPHLFDGSVKGTAGDGLTIVGSQNGTVRDNLIGWAGYSGISMNDNSTGWLIEHNEIRASGQSLLAGGNVQDGIDVGAPGLNSVTISGNLLAANMGSGIDSHLGVGGYTITDNTIDGNGVGGVETAGVRLFGNSGTTVRDNVITNSAGPGVLVQGQNGVTWGTSVANAISQNHFGANGSIAIDLNAPSLVALVHDQGDGITPNDAAPPSCGIQAGYGNRAQDFPVVATANRVGTLTVTGTSCALATIEVYKAAGDVNGEGILFLGSTAADGAGNWSLGGIEGMLSGDAVSVIAISASDTSEFAPNMVISVTNQTPAAADDTNTVDEDGDIVDAASVLGNDAGVGDLPLTLSVISGVTDGTLTFDTTDGTYDYSPDADFNGTDSFDYEVCDLEGECSTATVTITVNPVNDAPVAGDDAVSVLEDHELHITAATDMVANDTDVEDGTPTGAVAITTLPTNGDLIDNLDGTYDYHPDANFVGVDTFGYTVEDSDGEPSAEATVTITVTGINDPPTFDLLVPPFQSAPVDAGPQVVAGFFSNWVSGPADESGQGKSLSVTNDNNALFSAQPAIDTGTGNLTYTPAPGAGGSATVTVTSTDDGGTANGGDDEFVRTFKIAIGGFSVTKSADVGAGPVLPGSTITYSIAVTNFDSVDQTNVEITDTPPASTTWVSTDIVLPVRQTVRDEFTLNTTYSGSNGTVGWSGPWTETGDDGTASPWANGELVLVSDLGDHSLDLSGPGRSIQRELDLSSAMVATLTFDYRIYHLHHALEEVHLEIWDGASWNLIRTFTLEGPHAAYQPFTADITPYIAADTRIRFRTGAGTTTSEGMFVDNIQVRYSEAGPSAAGGDGTGGPHVSGFTLEPGETISMTYVVTIDDPPTAGSILNTVTATSDQTATTDDDVTTGLQNRAPVTTATASPPSPDEGASTGSFVLATYVDTDFADTHTATIDWGDGSPVEAGTVNQAADTVGGSHTYADDGTYTVTVTVIDAATASDADTFDITVSNVVPSIALGGDGAVDEGSTYTLTLGAITDPGADTVTQWDVDWGDGNSDTYGAGGDVTHVYADGAASPTITVDLTDEDGTHVAAGTKAITVNNVAPTIALGGDGAVDEGSTYTLTLGAITDPGADTVTQWDVDWGDGNSDTYGAGGDVTHVYADGAASPTITVDLTDEDGTHVAAGTKAITVNNVAPTIALGGDGAVDEGSTYTLTLGAITDPGADTVTQWDVDWGDGNSDTYGAGGDVTHIYADGVTAPTITVDLTDEDGTHVAAGTKAVGVANVAPTIVLSGDATVAEGALYSLTLGAITDPGADTVVQWDVDWGDGNSDTYAVGGIVTHTYADGATAPTIVVDLTDEDGTHLAAGTKAITVTNVVPTIALTNDGDVAEGSSWTLNFGAVTDPGADTATDFVVDWGDGSPADTYGAATGSASHTYADDGVFSVSVSVVDEDGTHAAAGSDTATITNVAPTIALAGNVSVDEGSTYTLTLGLVTDPGDDTVTTWVVDWGDGNSDVYASGGDKTHTYADGASSPTIVVDLVDEDATHLGAGTKAITIANVAPTIALSNDGDVAEGSSWTLNFGAVTDPGADTATDFVVDWGDGSPADTYGAATGSASHTYADDGVFSVSVSVVDEDGTHAAAGSDTATVSNVVPTIALSNDGDVAEGSSWTLNFGAVTDPGADTATDFVVDWGDGSPADTYGAATGSASHTYADDGVFSVSVSVVDEDGTHAAAGSDTATVSNVVPSIALGGDGAVDEGSTYTLTLGAITDPGADTVTQWDVDWGDGNSDTYGAGGDVTHVYADGAASPTITVDLTDEDGTHVAAGTKAITVNNVAPTIALGGDGAVDEGSTYTLTLGAITDPGADTVTQWDVDWGDGNSDTYGAGGDVTHIYADGVTAPTITVDLTDEDGTHVAAGTKAVGVANVAPTIVLSGDATVAEGALYSLTLGAITDPGADTVVQWDVDWGDGNSDTYAVGGIVTHTYADGATAPTIVVDLTDEDGTHLAAGTKAITVTNVVPTIALAGDAVVEEGATYTLTLGAITDPGADTVTRWDVDWGDGNSDSYAAGGDVTHVYADGASSPTITVDLTDEDGTHLAAGTKAITVTNVVPTIALGGDAVVEEGATYTLTLGAITDPGDDTVTRWDVDWGDGNSDTYFAAGDVTHVYAEGPATPTITVDVTDEDGTFAAAGTKAVTVANAAPVVDAGTDQLVDEGVTVSLDPATFTDAGAPDTHTATIDWGDGTAVEPGTVGAGTVAGSHVYADDGAYTVTVTVTDDDGGSNADTLTVTVGNLAPVVDAGADQSVDEGVTVSLDPATFTDAGTLDAHTATIDWGDGTAPDAGVVTETPTGPPGSTTPAAGTVAGSHVYADDGVYTVTVTVTDDDGGSHADTLTVTVGNVAPVVDAGADRPLVVEGDTVTLDPATFTDAGTLDAHTATIDWGDGTVADAGVVAESPSGPPGSTTPASGTVAGSHVYADDGVYTVTVTVTDDDGGSHADTLTVTVDNASPVVAAGADQSVDEGVTVSLDPADFTDAGTRDTHIASIDWGDGTAADAGVVVESPSGPPGSTTPAAGTVTGSHVYADDGVYTVTVTVIDDDGGSHADTLTVTVGNVAPVVDAGTDQIILEDATVTLDPASFTDAGTLDTHTATIDWGDGTPLQAGVVTEAPTGPPGSTTAASGTVSGSHTYVGNGVRTVTVTVTDDDGGSHADTFTVTITPVNDPPTFTKGTDVIVAEDAGAQSFPGWATAMSVGPPDDAGQSLTGFTVWNDNNALFSVQPAVDLAGQLTFTPAPDANGSATVSLYLSDDGGTANGGDDTSTIQAFTITVSAVPDTPVLAFIPDQSINETDLLAFTATATDGDGDPLTFSLQAGTDPVPAGASIVATGPNAGDFTWTPSSAQGPATYSFKIRVTDPGGLFDEQEFSITVIDLPPTAIDDGVGGLEDDHIVIDAIADLVTPNDTDLEDGVPAGAATIATPPSSGSLVDNLDGTWTYTPDPGFNGVDTFGYTVTDDAGQVSNEATVTVTITAVNDAPTFDLPAVPDQSLLLNAPAQSVPGFYTNPSAGPADEAGQTLTLTVSNDNPGLFSAQPAINPATGTLTYTPASGIRGTAIVTVRLRDDGGTANGGSDTTIKTFGIAVGQFIVAKSADVGAGPVLPGTTITYTLTVTNDDVIPHTSVVINDPPPAGTTWVSTTIVRPDPSTVNDDFGAVSYSNDDSPVGSVGWAGPWTEGGLETPTSPSAGEFRIHDAPSSGFRLGLDISGPNRSIQRPVDLSGVEYAAISFEYLPYHIEHAAEDVYVDIWDGSSWNRIHTFNGDEKEDEIWKPWGANITAYANASTIIRFSTPGTLTTSEGIFIDDLEIAYSVPSAPYAGGDGSGGPHVSGIQLREREQVTITYVVTVDDPATVGTVTNTATADTDQLAATVSAQVSTPLQNRAPVVDAGPDQPGRIEGQTVTLAPATFVDDDFNEVNNATINWGDGSPLQVGTVNQAADTVSGSHVYADNGTYTVTVTVWDDSLASGWDSFTVTVGNVAPVVDAGSDQSVNEGATVTLDPATFTDAGTRDTHTATIDWGDGTPADAGVVVESPTGPPGSTTPASGTVSGSHVYADDGVYTVTVTVTDDDGAVVADTLTVTVGNVAPSVDAGSDEVVTEGVTVSLDPATFADAGTLDTHTATIDWGDGTAADAGVVVESPSGPPGSTTPASGTVSGSHVYADDGVYTVTVTVSDDDGAVVADTLTVTVVNAAPVVDAGTDQSVDEGVTVSLDPATFTDAGTRDTHTATIDWGDGTPADAGVVVESPSGPPGSTTPAAGTVAGSHVYADDGVYTVTVTVTDDDGAVVADTLTVTVANVAPVVDAGTDRPLVVEGMMVTLDPATFTDAGTSDTHTATIDWGDGTPADAGVVVESPSGPPGSTTPAAGTVSGSHVYADDGVYTVIVTLTDDDGGIHSDSFTVTVDNATPVLDAGADQSVDEGVTVSLDPASFTDAGTLDTHTATVDWGDGTVADAGVVMESPSGPPGSTTPASGTVSGSHVYADDGVYTVTVTVTDDDGAVVADTLTVTVGNVAPSVDAGSDEVVTEGVTVSLDPATFADAGTLDTHTATIDWGDGTAADAGVVVESPSGPPGSTTPASGTVSGSHVYADDGVYTVTVTVSDDDGAVVADTLTVTVVNAAPVVDAGTDQSVDEGVTVSLDPATFTDAGTLDTHTATIDWGDGTAADVGVVVESPSGPPGSTTPAAGTVAGSHVYADDGVYTVTVTVTDDDGAVVADTFIVTVGNVAPVVDAGADQSVDEGVTVSLDPAAFTDAGTLDTHTATVDWGDGTPIVPGVVVESPTGPPGSTTPAAGTVAGSHVYADDGVYTVTVTVTDDDGAVVADTLTVTVGNAAPVVDAGTDQPLAVEGDLVTLDPATFTDAGAGDTHTATIDWGDGSAVDAGIVDQVLDTVSGSHAYADDGVYTVTVTVTDDDGDSDADTFTVIVDNASPLVDAGADQSVDEGVMVSLDPASFTDAGTLDTHTATVDWGDGTVADVGVVAEVPTGPPGSTTPAAGTVAGSHVYADDGVYTVTVTVTDDDGAVVADTFIVTVGNVAPVVDAGADQSVDEGVTVSLDPASFTDAGTLDTHTATVDWGDGTPADAGVVVESPSGPPGSTTPAAGTVAGSHVYADDGVYTVTVTVTDDDGAVVADTFIVTVGNVAPVVDAGADQSVDEGDTVSLDPASFTDAGTLDTHTATVDWGDGTAADAGVVVESPSGPPGSTTPAAGTVSGSHVYADDGVYTVTVTVTDDDGAVVADTFIVTVGNVAPVVDAGADQSVDEGDTVSLDPASFTDAGTLDTHTATVDWGDGTVADVGWWWSRRRVRRGRRRRRRVRWPGPMCTPMMGCTR